MSATHVIISALCALSLASCGYHLGGLKNRSVQGMDTCCVRMFDNNTFYAQAGMQMTSALTNALQGDGTFRLVAPSEADMIIEGVVGSVASSSVRTNLQDTYVSDEIRLTVNVSYRVIRTDDGNVLQGGQVRESVTCFLELGNVESAREDAVSYAVRKAADRIVEKLTTP